MSTTFFIQEVEKMIDVTLVYDRFIGTIGVRIDAVKGCDESFEKGHCGDNVT